MLFFLILLRIFSFTQQIEGKGKYKSRRKLTGKINISEKKTKQGGPEQAEPTAHAKINRAVGTPLAVEDLDDWMSELPDKLSGSDDDELLEDLKRLVPSFEPSVPQRVS